MRIAIRIAAVVIVLFVLALGGLAWYLPSLVQRPAVKARIVDAARQATGRTLEYQKLSVGLLPPRVLVEDPQLVAKGAPPVRAKRIALRVALLPLLSRTVLVDSVAVDGAQLPLERTAGGISVPGLVLGGGGKAGGKKPAPAEKAKPATGGVQVAVRKLSLSDGRIEWLDRTVSPPARLTLQDVSASARGIAPSAPIPFSVSASLASGGRIQAKGEAAQSGAFDAKVAVTDLALAPLGPYLGREIRAKGRLGVDAQAKGDAKELDTLVGSVSLDADDVGTGATRIQGSVPLKLTLSGPYAKLTGRFEADASRAEIVSGSTFKKAAGIPLTASGRIAALGGGRVVLDDLALHLASFVGTGRVDAGKRTQLELSAAPFDVAGLAQLLPSLGAQPPGGRIGLDNLRVALAPLAVHGDIAIDRLSVPVGRTHAILQGELRGTGSALEGSDLGLKVADEPFRVDARVTGLDRRPAAELRLRGDKVESGKLMAGLAGKSDVLQGPLTLDALLGTPLAGGDPVRQLAGTVRFDIKPGRLQGVSLLRSTFDQLGSVGNAALLAGRLQGGKTLQKFYGDQFEELGGTLRIAGGVARTNDLHLDYEAYRVDLRGSVGLADQKLDMTGTLTIFEKIDAALSGAQQLVSGGSAEQRAVKRRIPLAHVGGTLSAPQVSITPETAVSFAANYLTGSKQGRKILESLDKQLGPGGGQQVLDTLDAILGGKKSQPQQ